MVAQVRQIALPPDARALGTLARIDYEDAFLLDADVDGTPEQWARAVLEDAPPDVRRGLRRGWRALGLKLGSVRSGRRVLGWEVRRSTPDFVLLAAGSRIGMPGELLFKREPRGLLFATFVQQRNPVARALWARIAVKHQQVVRSLLTQAARRDGLRSGGLHRAEAEKEAVAMIAGMPASAAAALVEPPTARPGPGSERTT